MLKRSLTAFLTGVQNKYDLVRVISRPGDRVWYFKIGGIARVWDNVGVIAVVRIIMK